MRLRLVLLGLVSFIVSAPLAAQTIRGTVVDDGSKIPVASVLVTLIGDGGVEIPRGVRTDSLGNFIIHAARAGTWRVRAVRIGYSPATSDPVSLGVGGLAVLRLRMTTVAQQLVPVQVVERRQLSANELMSTAGFDLRETRGLGKFLSGERLAAMGRDGVREILGTSFQPTLYVHYDSVYGDVLRIAQGLGGCEPEVYLDGRLLATGPGPSGMGCAPPPTTVFDSARAVTRAESEHARLGAGQLYALALLSSFSAAELYGIEVYRANDVPPPSLGAWFGMTRAVLRPCGTVAVWTKAGAQSLITRRTIMATGRAVQVITGRLVDFETEKPVAGRTVQLLDESRDRIGSPVTTDEWGDFTIRTGRAGQLRLQAGGNDYIESTTPTFLVSANELIVVKLFVSAREGVLAPLGVAARVVPQNIGLTSLAGFTYRRERAQGGTFFRATDILRAGASSIADLVRKVEGAPSCTPAYYLDGAPVGGNAHATIAALPMHRVFGVEIYTKAAEIPGVFADAGACGIIAVWMNR